MGGNDMKLKYVFAITFVIIFIFMAIGIYYKALI